ncbi:MAG: heme-binding domain-containing protein [Chlorobiaceae bacterium]|nr:heme-binding domain-containing protein [Chlorobiaceae bacterium]
MNKGNSTTAGWIIIALILCQFVPLNRINPPSTTPSAIPADVRSVLAAHCYRCHSNETKWPVSAYIAPLSWIVVREVHKARNAMNLSNYRDSPPAVRSAVAKAIRKISESGNLSRHAGIPGFPQIRITGQERRTLLEWASDKQL